MGTSAVNISGTVKAATIEAGGSAHEGIQIRGEGYPENLRDACHEKGRRVVQLIDLRLRAVKL